MPNHIHGIITVQNAVGAHPCMRPNKNATENDAGENMVSPLRLGDYISWFKRMVTNEYIRMVKKHKLPGFYKRIWQRNYWERIIRNKNEYLRISKYISENPNKWENDKLNGGDGNLIMESNAEYDTENEIWML